MIALDTNVIVRFLTQDDADQARRAVAVFDELTADEPGFVSTVVWAELHWVLTRSYGFTPRDVVERIAGLSVADEIDAEDPAAVAAAVSSARRGADFADALIDAAAKRAGCDDVVTFDKRASTRLGWTLV